MPCWFYIDLRRKKKKIVSYNEHIPNSGTRPLFLTVVLLLPVEQGPSSANSASVVLENSAKPKPVSRWWERTLSLPIALFLTFKSAKIWWLVKEILVSEALGVYFPWGLIASLKMMTPMMDWRLVLNKLGRREKLCQRVMATLQC